MDVTFWFQVVVRHIKGPWTSQKLLADDGKAVNVALLGSTDWCFLSQSHEFGRCPHHACKENIHSGHARCHLSSDQIHICGPSSRHTSSMKRSYNRLLDWHDSLKMFSARSHRITPSEIKSLILLQGRVISRPNYSFVFVSCTLRLYTG